MIAPTYLASQATERSIGCDHCVNHSVPITRSQSTKAGRRQTGHQIWHLININRSLGGVVLAKQLLTEQILFFFDETPLLALPFCPVTVLSQGKSKKASTLAVA